MNDITKLPYSFAKKSGLLVTEKTDNSLHVIYKNPINLSAITELQRRSNLPMHLTEVDADTFQNQLTSSYEANSSLTQDVVEGMEESLDLHQLMDDLPRSEDLLDTQDDAPVIRLLNALFSEAIKQIASDIHLETFEQGVIVRMRIDGVLKVVLEVQRALAPLLISRIKVMAKLDIAEKRIPQDGRISINIAGHNVDVRVSTMPSSHGERIVMRILDKKYSKLDLNKLGMFESNLIKMQEMIKNPHGIILVTGPTGSGKTTSLYAMLNSLNQPSRNILTIEDPIEYDLPGIGQTQVNSKVDMSFAKGLRAMLRQDPDVVMVGEIRDKETAEIAVQASLTGHLVLSTLHTNTALGAIARLIDMGVEPFLLSSSLVGLIAQRLVRTLCHACKKPHTASQHERDILQLPDKQQKVTLYEPTGCDKCGQLGYIGRCGIYELIQINTNIQHAIHDEIHESDIEKIIRQHTPSIFSDGVNRIIKGDTTVAEVLRVTKQ